MRDLGSRTPLSFDETLVFRISVLHKHPVQQREREEMKGMDHVRPKENVGMFASKVKANEYSCYK